MTSDGRAHRAAAVLHSSVLPTEVDHRVAEIAVASPGLLEGPCADLRRSTLRVAVAGLLAADPGAATRRVVGYSATEDTVRVGGTEYPLTASSRVWVLGAGKASYPIAAALEELMGSRIAGGVVAVRDPGLTSLAHTRILRSDHPLPTADSVFAATEILAMAGQAGAQDLVITCFTGGSSALASLPPRGVLPEDKRILHELLLSSGLAITDVNVVRKAVSEVKGGRVAIAAAPATVVNLTVSDVAGSPLDAITDPTVQDRATAAQARSVLKASGLWDRLPDSIQAHLVEDLPTPTVARDPQTVMLADGAATVEAMAEAARTLGFRAVPVEQEVEGPADDVGPLLAERARNELASDSDQPVMVLGCGGESVVSVRIRDAFSHGGPNQHAALRAAIELDGTRSAALFIDTDGSDGGTRLAGALIDGSTMDLARRRGVDVVGRLTDQQSTQACLALDAGVRTGHTGTNVNDLFVVAAESGVVE